MSRVFQTDAQGDCRPDVALRTNCDNVETHRLSKPGEPPVYG
jgi:hypothetical protein